MQLIFCREKSAKKMGWLKFCSLSKTRYRAKKFNLNFCLSKIKHSRHRIQVRDTDWREWQVDRKGLHAGRCRSISEVFWRKDICRLKALSGVRNI